MRQVYPPAPTNGSGEQAGEARLQGHWLRGAQIVWLLVAALAALLFVVSLPVLFVQAQTICSANACNSGTQLTVDQARILEAHGISLASYAVYNIIITSISALAWLSIGWLIFWRKSNSWIALLLAFQLVTQSASNSVSVLEQSLSAWRYPATLLDFLNATSLFIVFTLFPNGRFAPRWLRWTVPVWIVYNVALYFIAPFITALNWLPGSSFLVVIVFMSGVVAAQIYRYRRVSTLIERQQTRWIVFAVATIILAQLLFVTPTLVYAPLSQASSLYTVLAANIMIFVLLLAPVAVYIAITRYRLYDIDVIIRRTLVYGALTTVLALIYFGLIVVLQLLLQTFIHSANNIVLVISTLTIAALFQPLRQRIQQFIDRRFYRRKYDAAKTIAAFSATLHNEVDLAQLSKQLVAVVEETMLPTHVSLWLYKKNRGLPLE